MKYTEIEKLINLDLDNQLSVPQKQQLQEAMDNDPEIARTVQQLRQADAAIKQALSASTQESDDSFETVWTQARDSRAVKSQTRWPQRLRFVTGLAAGLVIGLAVHWMNSDHGTPAVIAPQPSSEIANADLQPSTGSNRLLEPYTDATNQQPSIHNVDLYYFKDQQGRQWLVEGIRHEMIQQASNGI